MSHKPPSLSFCCAPGGMTTHCTGLLSYFGKHGQEKEHCGSVSRRSVNFGLGLSAQLIVKFWKNVGHVWFSLVCGLWAFSVISVCMFCTVTKTPGGLNKSQFQKAKCHNTTLRQQQHNLNNKSLRRGNQ